MKAKTIVVAAVALMFSVGAYAQNPAGGPGPHPRLTPEQRAARKAERKAKLAQMTPAERKAFKQAHREQRQARLNAMTPEQRERHERKRDARRALKGKV